MKVHELIDALAEHDPEAEVVHWDSHDGDGDWHCTQVFRKQGYVDMGGGPVVRLLHGPCLGIKKAPPATVSVKLPREVAEQWAERFIGCIDVGPLDGCVISACKAALEEETNG